MCFFLDLLVLTCNISIETCAYVLLVLTCNISIETCAYVLLSWYTLRGEALRPPTRFYF